MSNSDRRGKPRRSKTNANHPSNRKRRAGQHYGKNLIPPKRLAPLSSKVEREQVGESKIFTKIMELTGGDEPDHPKEAEYEGIFGIRAFDGLMASNKVQRCQVCTDVVDRFAPYLREANFEVGVQIEVIDRVDPEQPEFDQKRYRSQAPSYETAGAATITVVRFVDVPTDTNGQGYEIQVWIVTLIFGDDVSKRISENRRGKRDRTGPGQGAEIEWLNMSDPAKSKAIARKAIRSVINPSSVGPLEPRTVPCDFKPKRWKKKAPERALTILQILSMLPLKSQLIAKGIGKQLLDPAIKAAELRVKQDCKVEVPPLHRDGVVHFWASEHARLERTLLPVPLVKLH